MGGPLPSWPSAAVAGAGGADEADAVDGGLATERTALSWSRTGTSFATVGVVSLRLLDGAPALRAAVALGFGGLGLASWLWGRTGSRGRPAVDTAGGRALLRGVALGLVLTAAVGGLAQVS